MPIRHDPIARLDARAERGDDLVLVEHIDLPHLCFVVLVDDKDVIDVLADIEGVVRHRHDLLEHFKVHADIDQLARHQTQIGILERGAQFDRTGSIVDDIADEVDLHPNLLVGLIG